MYLHIYPHIEIMNCYDLVYVLVSRKTLFTESIDQCDNLPIRGIHSTAMKRIVYSRIVCKNRAIDPGYNERHVYRNCKAMPPCVCSHVRELAFASVVDTTDHVENRRE